MSAYSQIPRYQTNSCNSQLAVVKGLVIDRIQKMKSGRAVLGSRICRASYALSLDVPYNARKHSGQEVYKHYDGVLYARNQMDWMIRKVYYPVIPKLLTF